MAEPRYDIDGQLLAPGEPGMTQPELLQAWRERDERDLAEYGGDPAAANRALGLDNLATKMQDQAETNAFLRAHPEIARMQDEIFGLDPEERATLYPTAADDD